MLVFLLQKVVVSVSLEELHCRRREQPYGPSLGGSSTQPSILMIYSNFTPRVCRDGIMEQDIWLPHVPL